MTTTLRISLTLLVAGALALVGCSDSINNPVEDGPTDLSDAALQQAVDEDFYADDFTWSTLGDGPDAKVTTYGIVDEFKTTLGSMEPGLSPERQVVDPPVRGHVLTGVGGAISRSKNDFVKLVIEARPLYYDGTLGPRVRYSDPYADPSTEGLQAWVNVPEGRLITGVQMAEKDGRLYWLKLYHRQYDVSTRSLTGTTASSDWLSRGGGGDSYARTSLLSVTNPELNKIVFGSGLGVTSKKKDVRLIQWYPATIR